jgi:putative endonuclease
MQSWFVYLLRCSDDSLYCGITTNINRRLNEHNAGTASKYTRSRLPVSLETHIAVENKSKALKLELKVKKQQRAKKIGYLKSLNK